MGKGLRSVSFVGRLSGPFIRGSTVDTNLDLRTVLGFDMISHARIVLSYLSNTVRGTATSTAIRTGISLMK